MTKHGVILQNKLEEQRRVNCVFRFKKTEIISYLISVIRHLSVGLNNLNLETDHLGDNFMSTDEPGF